jgi:hypothetical protein
MWSIDAVVGLSHNLFFLIVWIWAGVAVPESDAGVSRCFYLPGFFSGLGQTKGLLA